MKESWFKPRVYLIKTRKIGFAWVLLTLFFSLFVQGEAANGVGIAATGNASQSLNKGGWVKAMVHVSFNGTIFRCYNGLTGAATGSCGFSVNPFDGSGLYTVDFGFQIRDRFVSVTAGNFFQASAGEDPSSPNRIRVTTATQNGAGSALNFYLIVY